MLTRLAAAVVLAAACAACDESLAELAGPTPALTPTFSSIQRDILEASDAAGRVACTTCHNPASPLFRQSGLDLRSAVAYDQLVGVRSRQRNLLRVAPGDVENSYLIHKLEGRSGIFGDRMPQTAPFLTDGQIAIIERWIERGALRD